MATTLIENARIVTQDRVLEGHAVLLSGGRIATVLGPGGGKPGADEVIDASGRYLAPGFIDLHIHGLLGSRADFSAAEVATMSRQLTRYGVTGWLPTLIPKPKGEDARYLEALSGVRTEGAAILGFHLEGPFLALPGAMDPARLGKADEERVARLIEAADPYPAIFSVSPDFEGILGLLPRMSAQDTPVFMTHTRADVEQTRAAIDAGVTHATHFYDVFPAPPETDPGVRACGVVEAVLADPRVSVDFILDGEHVHPVAVQMAIQCKGIDKVCLVTDSNLGAGLPPGEPYASGEFEITHRYAGGPGRIRTGPLAGLLAGSGLTLDQAVRNAVRLLGLDVPSAVRMAASSPALTLGLQSSKGRVEEGYDADLVLLDGNLNVTHTWVAGQSRFSAAHAGGSSA